MKSNRCLK